MANRVRTAPASAEQVKPVETPSGEQVLYNLEDAFEKNKRWLSIAGAAIVIGVLAVVGYIYGYQQPREDKARNAIYYAERYFENDSLDKAINGDGVHLGLVKILKKYDGTKTANMCHFYAGVAFLKKGEFKTAIKYLRDFDGKGTLLQNAAYGALGDAYMESGDLKNGIDNYTKAASDKEDFILTPLYLLRAGLAYEKNQKPKEAIAVYRRIHDEYPNSTQYNQVELLLAHLGVID